MGSMVWANLLRACEVVGMRAGNRWWRLCEVGRQRAAGSERLPIERAPAAAALDQDKRIARHRRRLTARVAREGALRAVAGDARGLPVTARYVRWRATRHGYARRGAAREGRSRPMAMRDGRYARRGAWVRRHARRGAWAPPRASAWVRSRRGAQARSRAPKGGPPTVGTADFPAARRRPALPPRRAALRRAVPCPRPAQCRAVPCRVLRRARAVPTLASRAPPRWGAVPCCVPRGAVPAPRAAPAPRRAPPCAVLRPAPVALGPRRAAPAPCAPRPAPRRVGPRRVGSVPCPRRAGPRARSKAVPSRSVRRSDRASCSPTRLLALRSRTRRRHGRRTAVSERFPGRRRRPGCSAWAPRGGSPRRRPPLAGYDDMRDAAARRVGAARGVRQHRMDAPARPTSRPSAGCAGPGRWGPWGGVDRSERVVLARALARPGTG